MMDVITTTNQEELTSRNGRLTTRLRQRPCPRKERGYRPIIFFLKQRITPGTVLVILSPPLGGMKSITTGAIVHVFIGRMVVGRRGCKGGR
eukprot:scaffold17325_cov109-Skeletonema_dohrnii-CCMP3373.AAC.1